MSVHSSKWTSKVQLFLACKKAPSVTATLDLPDNDDGTVILAENDEAYVNGIESNDE